MKRQVILASASPRRRELLGYILDSFKIIPSNCDEIIQYTVPEQVVKQLALDKARDVSALCDSNDIVIGADTIVVYEDRILGKPENNEDAYDMLKMLSGHTHSVYTGVAVICGSAVRNFVKETKVVLNPMSHEEILSYVGTGDCMDKAGSYGIQGIFSKYVDKIDGDYNNVVGLPVSELYKVLKEFMEEDK